jgi:hypothetical protein
LRILGAAANFVNQIHPSITARSHLISAGNLPDQLLKIKPRIACIGLFFYNRFTIASCKRMK